MKLFKTTNMEIIKACQGMFHCKLPSVQLIEEEEEEKFISSISYLFDRKV